ncbi:hypothetical protein OO006_10700 [Prosthecochloris sp. SCSIO W1101]|nr:hypothetical protein [Prosthecochloris sp. SCSIO W1101]UZJ40816.1 hypothetical protein OO006_10700 [Prosthecochloris sp. SCSIO W1101]
MVFITDKILRLCPENGLFAIEYSLEKADLADAEVSGEEDNAL